jgi:hypothetical protein
VAAPTIAAHARHTLLLQPGESIAECFGGEAGDAPEQLLFEVSVSGAGKGQHSREWEMFRPRTPTAECPTC